MPKPVFEMKVDGIDQLLKTFKGYFDDISTDIDILTSMAIIGKDVGGKAQDILGVIIYSTPESPSYDRTGLLRARISSDDPKVIKDTPTVTIRATQEYAPFIELGTKKPNPRPFLRPAALAENDNSLKTLTKGLTKFLKKKVVK